MFTQETRQRLELLRGTLDLSILLTLILGSQHGQGMARAIQQTSQEELLVEHGSLLLADRGRPHTTNEGDRHVEASGGSHRADTGPRKGGLTQCFDASGRKAISAPKSKHTYSM